MYTNIESNTWNCLAIKKTRDIAKSNGYNYYDTSHFYRINGIPLNQFKHIWNV